jgi:hypothetical protein
VNGFLSQGVADALGLPATCFVEVNVEVALNAGVHIPQGFPVVDSENSGGLHRA